MVLMPYKELKRAVVRSFLPLKAQKIILFGSYARGEADEFSDVDIVIVQDTEKRFLDRLEDAYMCWDLPVGVDILVYTPQEFEQMLARGNSLVEMVVREGDVVYEG